MHAGPNFAAGHSGGEQAHTITIAEMAGHSHTAQASSSPADQTSAPGNLWANGNQSAYDAGATGALNPATVAAAGASQAHNNMSPYLVLNFMIALQGTFPA